jgi:hypothetical protein
VAFDQGALGAQRQRKHQGQKKTQNNAQNLQQKSLARALAVARQDPRVCARMAI